RRDDRARRRPQGHVHLGDRLSRGRARLGERRRRVSRPRSDARDVQEARAAEAGRVAVSTNLANLLYLITIVTFILALRYLSSPAHARRGNQIGAAGMLLAVVVTWIRIGTTSWWAIALGMLIGGGFGAVAARKVRMTAMPQRGALVDGGEGGEAADGGAVHRRRRRPRGVDRPRGAPPHPPPAGHADGRRLARNRPLGADRLDLVRRLDGRIRKAPGADPGAADHLSGPAVRQRRHLPHGARPRARARGRRTGTMAPPGGRAPLPSISG